MATQAMIRKMRKIFHLCRRGNDATDFSTRADRRRGDSAVEICFFYSQRGYKWSGRRGKRVADEAISHRCFIFWQRWIADEASPYWMFFFFTFGYKKSSRATCFVYRSGKPTARTGMATRRFLSSEATNAERFFADRVLKRPR